MESVESNDRGGEVSADGPSDHAAVEPTLDEYIDSVERKIQETEDCIQNINCEIENISARIMKREADPSYISREEITMLQSHVVQAQFQLDTLLDQKKNYMDELKQLKGQRNGI